MEELDAGLLAETENFMIWTSELEDDILYHLELGGITLHLTHEEWDEFVTLCQIALSD